MNMLQPYDFIAESKHQKGKENNLHLINVYGESDLVHQIFLS